MVGYQALLAGFAGDIFRNCVNRLSDYSLEYYLKTMVDFYAMVFLLVKKNRRGEKRCELKECGY